MANQNDFIKLTERGIKKAVANAIAWHKREGREKDVRRAQIKPEPEKQKTGKKS